MFDIGGWEFLLIVVLGIIIIGPKELPGTIRTISSFVRKAREMAREFQWGMEEIAREADLDKVAKEVTGGTDPSMLGYELKQDIENTIDPGGEIRDVARDAMDGGIEDGNTEWVENVEAIEEQTAEPQSSDTEDADEPERQADDAEPVTAKSDSTP